MSYERHLMICDILLNISFTCTSISYNVKLFQICFQTAPHLCIGKLLNLQRNLEKINVLV